MWVNARRRNKSISFRGYYNYDDPVNVKHELRSSIRRGLLAVADDVGGTENGKNDDETIISEQLDAITVDDMTSIDIHNDHRAHFGTHTGILKDVFYTRCCWKAICRNSQLFKDKVHSLIVWQNKILFLLMHSKI